MSDIRLASQVGIDRSGLIIEGKRLPFLLAAGPIEIETDELGLPSIVRVGILAESVHIDPTLDVETDGDVDLVSIPDGDFA